MKDWNLVAPVVGVEELSKNSCGQSRHSQSGVISLEMSRIIWVLPSTKQRHIQDATE